jgi:hypothetical protein
MRWQKHATAKPGRMFKHEAQKGFFSHVDSQHFLKQPGLMSKDTQCFSAKTGRAIHEQHDARHGLGQMEAFRMAGGVRREVVIGYCAGQQESLPKAHGHTLAGDGVGRSGCIADESDVSADDTTKPESRSKRTPLAGRNLSMHQLLP